MKDKFTTVNDIKLHYLDSGGNKPILVWLHGISGTAYSFYGLINEGITKHMRVVAPTMRGRGQSEKPEDGDYSLDAHANDVLAIMDLVNAEAVMLGGHSFGGLVAAYIAYHYPDRVEKLVLGDAAAQFDANAPELLEPTYQMLEKAHPFEKHFLNAAKMSPVLNGFWDDAIEKAYAALVRNEGGMVKVWAERDVIDGSRDGVNAESWSDMFKQIELPTLLLNAPEPYGSADANPILPRDFAMATANMMRNGNYIRVVGNHTTMLFGKGAKEMKHAILNFAGLGNTKTEDQPFRFFDNREKYLLFVTTTSEKSVTAAHVGRELEHIQPTPPAIKLFDAGMGNGTVLSRVLREMHCRFPTVPFVVVGKEISLEDTRLSLDKLADRFYEHPNMVVVITNLYYKEAPWLEPHRKSAKEKLQWWDVSLKGDTSHGFSQQIEDLDTILQKGWQTKSSEKSGNPLYVTPSVLVLYREDQAFALDNIIPRKGRYKGGYDMVIAAQPYRSRQSADFKVSKVLAPLAKSLAVNGRMVVVQSTGHDPGMEIIRNIWPKEEPFATPRHLLIKTLEKQLNAEETCFSFDGFNDSRSLFSYHLHALPDEIGSNIGTSTLLAAWNAAVYVAQIEDDRLTEKLRTGEYLDATKKVLQRHGGLWFQDESFVIVRDKKDENNQ